MQDGVFWEKGKFCYLQDFTNSIGLTLLYFLSYFLSAFYTRKAVECFQGILKEELLDHTDKKLAGESKKIRIYSKICGAVLFITGTLVGYLFFRMAGQNPEAFWIVNLSLHGKIIYCVLLGLTWYHSFDLLGLVYIVGYIIFWSLKGERIEYKTHYFSKNTSVMKVAEILFIDFSYGLFYIGVAVLAIINDKCVAVRINGNIRNALWYSPVALGLMCLVLLAVLLAYIPVKEFVAYMKEQKNTLLMDLDKQISCTKDEAEKRILMKKRDEIINAPIIYSSWTSKLILILSVVIPAIGVIAQFLSLKK